MTTLQKFFEKSRLFYKKSIYIYEFISFLSDSIL